MDTKAWINADRRTPEYKEGFELFLQFSQGSLKDGKMRCPCVKCLNSYMLPTSEVRAHGYINGFNKHYLTWIWHGEQSERRGSECSTSRTYEDNSGHMEVEMDQRTENSDGASDSFYDLDDSPYDGADRDEEDEAEDNLDDQTSDDDPYAPMDEEVVANNIEMVNDAHESCLEDNPRDFKRLLDDAETPLYPGCSKFTKLSAMVKLYNLKSKYGVSDVGFTELLRLLGDMLPEGHVLPNSLYKVRKSMSRLGLGYEKIHCCPNKCMLYRKEYETVDKCPKCKTSRWKLDDTKKPRVNVAAKVMWYFPPIARFRRMFRNPEMSQHLTWHSTQRKETFGKLRHPADSPQWKILDSRWPNFGREPRNLRLGLSTDGINPHKHMSSTHSCWPVMTVAYNLPPWMCMKRKFIMLTALISGPKQPGDDIDVFLQPLIDDLQLLWREGVKVWDAYRNEFFTLRAALLWTINDFPAYGNLSGHTVHGYLACPICSEDTNSARLEHSGKATYWGHRRWLDMDHPYRWQTKPFNGEQEFRTAPVPLTGEEIFQKLSTKVFHDPVQQGECWKRKSIFWNLHYWKSLYVRHNLDVMHIEKNVCEALVGTILNIPGKTKDGVNARKDMLHIGIRQHLAPEENARKGKSFLPAAAHAIKKDEKQIVLGCLSNIKVPDGYSSNFQNKVSMKTLTFKAMKSHDLHVLMQQFFPIAIRSVLHPDVRVAAIRMCSFFNEVCKKEIVVGRLDEIQKELVITLCLLEQFFPPAFFDIMVHVTVHLIREIKLCGPVHFRWMYPFERYMKVLKGYVRNHTYPEGCIVENYIAEEAVEFCSHYQKGLGAIGNPPGRYEMQCGPDAGIGEHLQGGTVKAVQRKELMQVHTYILNNTPEVDIYISQHLRMLRSDSKNRSRKEQWFQEEHNRTFPSWFKNEVTQQLRNKSDISSTLRGLANGPSYEVIKYAGYDINGFRFHTYDRDKARKTQNFGITLVAQEIDYSTGIGVSHDVSFYGIVDEIWDLQYASFRIPVFKCSWIDNTNGLKKDELGFTLVTFSEVGHHEDSFVMASQARQVFYVRDPADPAWFVVLNPPQYKVHTSSEDNEADDITSIPNPFVSEISLIRPPISRYDTDQMCRRTDCEGEWV